MMLLHEVAALNYYSRSSNIIVCLMMSPKLYTIALSKLLRVPRALGGSVTGDLMLEPPKNRSKQS